MTSLRFVDWFCGVGGIRLGLERAGHRCVWSCEIDEFARSVYGARFGHAPEGKDIREVQASDIPEADLWVGGFPCQDLSTAGLRAGFGGGRSGLVWRLLDLAADVRPDWLLLENVPGMLSVDGGHGFGGLLARLDELGFVGAWRVLDARFFGVPQRRRRVFVLAGRAGDGRDPASLLVESEGVRGRAPARGETGTDVAGTLGGGSGERGWCDDLDRAGAFIPEVAATLTSRGEPSGSPPGRRHEDMDNLVAFQCHGSNVGPMGTLRSGHNHGSGVPFVVNAETSCAKESHARESDVARCLDSTGGYASAQGGTVVAVAVRGREGGASAELREDGTANALRDGSKGGASAAMILAFDPTQVTHPENRSKCEPGGPSPSLAARAMAPHIAFSIVPEGGQGADLRAAEVDVSGAVTTETGGKNERGVRIVQEAAVRRLTPRECERLQGFPDDWTLIEGASDARRYKVIGNSVAVPVLEWIGRRLARA